MLAKYGLRVFTTKTVTVIVNKFHK